MARPLKVFAVHGHASYVPHHIINDVIGAPSHIRQGNIYVVARTKKDASQFLGEKLGSRYKVSEIDEARGIHFEAFMNATAFLDVNSPVFEGAVAVSWGNGGERFAVETVNGWTLVGETTHQDPENPRRYLQKPIFVPVKVAPKPVRVTIELDADMDPELVAKLLAGGRCTIAFGRITAREVVGKVVES